MKIVHVCHLYHPSTGGVQFYFKNVSERLVRNYGDDVTVVTTNSYYGPERKIFKKIEPSEENINGVKVIRFSYRRWHISMYRFIQKALIKLSVKPPGWLMAQAYGPYSNTMKHYLIGLQADAICASSSNYYYMQLPMWRKCNFFYFGSIHLSEDRSKQVISDIQRNSINKSTAYIANTVYEKNRLREAGITEHKIKVLGVGVDENEFKTEPAEVENFRQSLGLGEEDVLIAYVGRIERTKNVLLLIKAFEKLAATMPDAYLLIAGSSKDHAQELEDYCSSLPANVNGRIKWKVNFSLDEKAVLFNALDILVLPSNNESFGIVFLEAWICKKPVVGVNIGAVKDVISDNRDGLLMNMDDVESLVKHLGRLTPDNDLRKEMGERGYEKVIRNYTWDIITTKLRQLYMEGMRSNSVSKETNVQRRVLVD